MTTRARSRSRNRGPEGEKKKRKENYQTPHEERKQEKQFTGPENERSTESGGKKGGKESEERKWDTSRPIEQEITTHGPMGGVVEFERTQEGHLFQTSLKQNTFSKAN